MAKLSLFRAIGKFLLLFLFFSMFQVLFSSIQAADGSHRTSLLASKLFSVFSKANGYIGHGSYVFSYIVFTLFLFGFCTGYRVGVVYQICALVAVFLFGGLLDWVQKPVLEFLMKAGLTQYRFHFSFFLSLALLIGLFYVMVLFNNMINVILYVLFLRHFNKFLGGVFGLIQTVIMMSILIAVIDAQGVILPENTFFIEELRFTAERLCKFDSFKTVQEWLANISESKHN